MPQIGVYLSPEQDDQVDDQKKSLRFKSKSDVLAMIITEYLNNLKKNKK